MDNRSSKEKLLLMLISAHQKGIVSNAVINASFYPETNSNLSLLEDENYIEKGSKCEYKENSPGMPSQYYVSCKLTDKALNYLK